MPAKRKKTRKKQEDVTRLERDRTLLADDRTLLSYIRTALSFFVFSIFLVKFFPDFPQISLIFFLVVGLGIVILIIGFVEYLFYRKEVCK